MTMTSEDVAAVLDPVDWTLVTEVIATGATQAELAIVFAIDDVDHDMAGPGGGWQRWPNRCRSRRYGLPPARLWPTR